MASALGAEQTRERISTALDAIDAAHEVLRETSSDVVGNDFRVDVAERLETQDRVNRGLTYRFFGEIADPPDEATPTAQVRAALWKRLRITPHEITRRVKLAARIRPRRSLTGPPVPPELPELAAAVTAGTVGDDHIRALCRAVDVLPANVSPTDVAAAERRLVREASKVDAGIVIRLGQRIADYLNPDGQFSDEDRARRRGLSLGAQGPDGMSRLSGLLDPEARAYFEAIEAAVRPGRHQPDGSDPEARDERTPAQRCHDAFKLGLKTAIASGGLGTHRGHPVTVVVTTTLAELDRAAHAVVDPSVPMPAPARTGGGSRLPMRDLIRMAANGIHLREWLRAYAARHPRWGYRRAYHNARAEGWVVNHKKVQRLWRQEGLKVRVRRRRKRVGVSTRESVPAADAPNVVWAIDFQYDSTTDGRPIKILSAVDEHTRECLGGVVERSITAEALAAELDRIVMDRGAGPRVLRLDNGPEMIAAALAEWAGTRSGMLFIPPGEPWRNPFIESFNGRLRDECLNLNVFWSLTHARVVIADWKREYNCHRPHSALGYQPPARYADACRGPRVVAERHSPRGSST